MVSHQDQKVIFLSGIVERLAEAVDSFFWSIRSYFSRIRYCTLPLNHGFDLSNLIWGLSNHKPGMTSRK
jgi:hypothetical protein